MLYFDGVSTPVGRLHVVTTDEVIVRVYLPKETWTERFVRTSKHPLVFRAKEEIREYIGGKRRTFDLPISFEKGTVLQQKVWHALQKIPYGATVSYQELARMVGSPRAVRAVASAVGKNPLPIIIPCHRVIRSDGTVGNYVGGEAMKRTLLEFERRHTKML